MVKIIIIFQKKITVPKFETGNLYELSFEITVQYTCSCFDEAYGWSDMCDTRISVYHTIYEQKNARIILRPYFTAQIHVSIATRGFEQVTSSTCISTTVPSAELAVGHQNISEVYLNNFLVSTALVELLSWPSFNKVSIMTVPPVSEKATVGHGPNQKHVQPSCLILFLLFFCSERTNLIALLQFYFLCIYFFHDTKQRARSTGALWRNGMMISSRILSCRRPTGENGTTGMSLTVRFGKLNARVAYDSCAVLPLPRVGAERLITLCSHGFTDGPQYLWNTSSDYVLTRTVNLQLYAGSNCIVFIPTRGKTKGGGRRTAFQRYPSAVMYPKNSFAT